MLLDAFTPAGEIQNAAWATSESLCLPRPSDTWNYETIKDRLDTMTEAAVGTLPFYAQVNIVFIRIMADEFQKFKLNGKQSDKVGIFGVFYTWYLQFAYTKLDSIPLRILGDIYRDFTRMQPVRPNSTEDTTFQIPEIEMIAHLMRESIGNATNTKAWTTEIWRYPTQDTSGGYLVNTFTDPGGQNIKFVFNGGTLTYEYYTNDKFIDRHLNRVYGQEKVFREGLNYSRNFTGRSVKDIPIMTATGKEGDRIKNDAPVGSEEQQKYSAKKLSEIRLALMYNTDTLGDGARVLLDADVYSSMLLNAVYHAPQVYQRNIADSGFVVVVYGSSGTGDKWSVADLKFTELDTASRYKIHTLRATCVGDLNRIKARLVDTTQRLSIDTQADMLIKDYLLNMVNDGSEKSESRTEVADFLDLELNITMLLRHLGTTTFKENTSLFRMNQYMFEGDIKAGNPILSVEDHWTPGTYHEFFEAMIMSLMTGKTLTPEYRISYLESYRKNYIDKIPSHPLFTVLYGLAKDVDPTVGDLIATGSGTSSVIVTAVDLTATGIVANDVEGDSDTIKDKATQYYPVMRFFGFIDGMNMIQRGTGTHAYDELAIGSVWPNAKETYRYVNGVKDFEDASWSIAPAELMRTFSKVTSRVRGINLDPYTTGDDVLKDDSTFELKYVTGIRSFLKTNVPGIFPMGKEIVRTTRAAVFDSLAKEGIIIPSEEDALRYKMTQDNWSTDEDYIETICLKLMKPLTAIISEGTKLT
jgi:hypothetical protein